MWLHEFSGYMLNRAEGPNSILFQYNNNLVIIKYAHSSSILPILIYKINEAIYTYTQHCYSSIDTKSYLTAKVAIVNFLSKVKN